MRSVLTLFELSSADIHQVFAVSADLKARLADGDRPAILPGRSLALIFEKPSLRTRVSFETAMTHLGGGCIFLGQEAGFGQRESIADFSRVLSEYVDVIVCRAKSHHTVEQLAHYGDRPVINGLTDLAHPCQALADLFTVQERFGKLAGLTLAYVGDANNVARSLAVACGRLGVKMAIASPKGYEFDAAFLAELRQEIPKLQLTMTADPAEAVRGANAVYTDVWTSMGQEAETESRRKIFRPYQVNASLMALASPDAIFLHCLPAKRGEEVTDDVIDGAQSAVVPQAGNRLHAQKGLIVTLLAPEWKPGS